MAYIEHLDCFEDELDSPINNSVKVKVLVTNPISASQARQVADSYITSRFNEEINSINTMIDMASKNGRHKLNIALLDVNMASKVVDHYTKLNFKASTYNYSREVTIDWSEAAVESIISRDICT